MPGLTGGECCHCQWSCEVASRISLDGWLLAKQVLVSPRSGSVMSRFQNGGGGRVPGCTYRRPGS